MAETPRTSRSCTGYRTGGTIHIVVNNQIGFTTAPPTRSSTLLHRRRQDDRGADLPRQRRGPRGGRLRRASWRTTSARRSDQDVVIDMVCYRRHGHNEGDEPAFTQPLMYGKIAQHRTVRAALHRAARAGRRASSPARRRRSTRRSSEKMESAHEASHAATSRTRPTGSRAPGRACARRRSSTQRGETGVPSIEILRELGRR